MIEIRKEQYIHKGRSTFTILFLSDLHLNRWSANIINLIIKKINDLNPDILLLGGDYVDSKRGFLYFKALMSALAERSNVFAIAGNHDYFWGVDKIREIVIQSNGIWIEKSAMSFTINGAKVRIDGNKPQKTDDSAFNILCLHKPISIERYNYNLAFAGHLHGGQVVLWQTEKGLYPARFFYKWNRLKIQFKNTLFLISKGLGDTLPIRYNCMRDIIFVEINPNV